MLLANFAAAIHLVLTTDLQAGIAANGKPVYSLAAESMSSLGVRPGDKISVIGPEPFGEGGAFVARLGRNRIVAETSGADLLWITDPLLWDHYVAVMKGLGVKAVIIRRDVRNLREGGWRTLGVTDYQVFLIVPSAATARE